MEPGPSFGLPIYCYKLWRALPSKLHPILTYIAWPPSSQILNNHLGLQNQSIFCANAVYDKFPIQENRINSVSITLS